MTGIMGRVWGDKEMDRARKLRAGGMSYGEIGKALGRTERAVTDAFHRARIRADVEFHPYLRDLNGPPIGTDDEMLSFKHNAVVGSQKLLAEIQRVFG